jgi:hypothetical protein
VRPSQCYGTREGLSRTGPDFGTSQDKMLLSVSPRWARILYMRVLNAPAAREELVSAVGHQADQARAAVRRILDDIDRKRPGFTSKTKEVRRWV